MPSQLDQRYERCFIVRYDMTLLPLTDALLPASLSDAMIHRALTACGMVDLESRIDFLPIFRSDNNVNMANPYDLRIIRTLSPEGMPPGTKFCLLGFRCSKEVPPKVRAKIWTAVVQELGKFWQKTQNAAEASRLTRIAISTTACS